MHNHSYSIRSLVPSVLFFLSLEASEGRHGTGQDGKKRDLEEEVALCYQEKLSLTVLFEKFSSAAGSKLWQ